jgi:cholesterol oxidase
MGVTDNPRMFEPDRHLRETAAEYGRGHTFRPSPVGVYFGEPEQEVADPYFHGQGPPRQGCSFCGACFVGCRHRAKNSLDVNYLYLAEQLGACVLPERRVTAIQPLSADGADGYLLHTRRSTSRAGQPELLLRVRAVVVAAGVLGSLRLLWDSKLRGYLPRLSPRLGHDVRSNGEALVGVLARDRAADYSEGLAASSSVFPDEHTQVQVDRFPAGSDHLALMSTLLVDGGGPVPRPLRLLAAVARRPADWLRAAVPFGFARRGVVLVVMQDLDSALRIVPKRRWYWRRSQRLATEPDGRQPLPTYLPMANDFARRMARRMGGIAMSASSEVLLDVPATAHILGGCIIADRPEAGVVDAQQRVFGYQNLLVCDGSVLPTNLGVNPALSILAFAERALSFVPPKHGDASAIRWLEVDRRWGVQELMLAHGRAG